MSKTAAFCQKFLVNDANKRGERRKEETKKMEDWCVGADAYIGPAECTILTELFGESVLPCKFRTQGVFTADIKS